MASEKARTLAISRAIAIALKERAAGTALSVQLPRSATTTNTRGWAATIGTLGGKSVQVEVWLDRYARLGHPNLSACFWSEKPSAIKALTERVPRTLMPVRTITADDVDNMSGRKSSRLRSKLPKSALNTPVVEYYKNERSNFFSVYSTSNGVPGGSTEKFCNLAVSFFEAVARAQRDVDEDKEQWREVYARENRRQAIAHVRRERSTLLAVQRKLADDYTCQVCGLQFIDLYGDLGKSFAEAHHLKALHTIRGTVISTIDDLVTVCCNCHAMLHKMPGRPKDVAKLQDIVAKHRGSRRK